MTMFDDTKWRHLEQPPCSGSLLFSRFPSIYAIVRSISRRPLTTSIRWCLPPQDPRKWNKPFCLQTHTVATPGRPPIYLYSRSLQRVYRIMCSRLIDDTLTSGRNQWTLTLDQSVKCSACCLPSPVNGCCCYWFSLRFCVENLGTSLKDGDSSHLLIY